MAGSQAAFAERPPVGLSTYGGLFFTTLSTLMYEILLTRIFSVTMWYHFAFVAVSVALFGMTVGGRLYCDYHGWGGEYPRTQISWGKQIEITNADGEMAVWFLDSLDKANHLILIMSM